MGEFDNNLKKANDFIIQMFQLTAQQPKFVQIQMLKLNSEQHTIQSSSTN